jgi:hypothetical protein
VLTLNYNFTNDLWIRLFAQNSTGDKRIYVYGLFGWRFKPPFGAVTLISGIMLNAQLLVSHGSPPAALATLTRAESAEVSGTVHLYLPELARYQATTCSYSHDTYGFPLDLTELMARERGLTVDVGGFQQVDGGAARPRPRCAEEGSHFALPNRNHRTHEEGNP